MNKGLLTLMLAGGLFLVAGCSNEPGPVGTPGDNNQARLYQAVSVPADAIIDSARVFVHVTSTDTLSVNVHRVTGAWAENDVTWNSFGGAFAPTSLTTMAIADTGWYAVDITAEAQGWFGNTVENFGFAFVPGETDTSFALLDSREAAAGMPYLEVCYTTWEGSTCDTFSAVADAQIYSALPDQNAGALTPLTVQRQPTTGSIYQTLVRFDFTVEVRYCAVGDRVWNDQNADGLQSDGEPGLAGVTVNLYDCENTLVATTVTDEQGLYRFDSLAAGSYYLGFVRPDGYIFTLQDIGADDALDSDIDRCLGRTVCFTLMPGQEITDWDAGLYAFEGCTYSKGFWKNHAGFGPQADVVTPLLPIWLGDAVGAKSLAVTDAQIAVDVLSQDVYGVPSTGITKLYAQLLAAKLNIANFADPTDIAQTIADADSFLAEHDWMDWGSLDQDQRQMVLGWKDQLDQYNNGLIGPGHCDDNDDSEDRDDDSEDDNDDVGADDL